MAPLVPLPPLTLPLPLRAAVWSPRRRRILAAAVLGPPAHGSPARGWRPRGRRPCAALPPEPRAAPRAAASAQRRTSQTALIRPTHRPSTHPRPAQRILALTDEPYALYRNTDPRCGRVRAGHHGVGQRSRLRARRWCDDPAVWGTCQLRTRGAEAGGDRGGPAHSVTLSGPPRGREVWMPSVSMRPTPGAICPGRHCRW
jgi:hypothetical protein